MENITKPYKGNYTKHLAAILIIGIPLLIVTILFVLLPFGDRFKQIKKEKLEVDLQYQKIALKYKEYKKHLYKLQIEEQKHLEKLYNPNPIEDFVENNPFIDKVYLIAKEVRGKIEKSVYKVETRALYGSLENFYDLLKNSSKYGIKFGVDFPIHLISENNRKLKIVFNMNVYKMKKRDEYRIQPYKELLE
jgi:hypothetical protein